MPNPPVPTEIKRRRGTARPDRCPDPATVTVLPMAGDVPEPPTDLDLAGRALWARAWGAAITWLSPDSDMERVVEACHLVDDVARARARYRATNDTSDLRATLAASEQLGKALSAMGFDPVSRTRMGLAEVRKVDALESILARRKGN